MSKRKQELVKQATGGWGGTSTYHDGRALEAFNGDAYMGEFGERLPVGTKITVELPAEPRKTFSRMAIEEVRDMTAAGSAVRRRLDELLAMTEPVGNSPEASQ